jgi:geranylgeranyl diphosphate synthase type I
MADDKLQYLSQLMIPAVIEEMQSVLETDDPQGDLFYGMMHYHMGWVNEDLSPIDNQGGKRVRPLICLLVTQASGGHWTRAVPAAASVELLHNFTLIHDDIQDDSPTRRGRPTVWRLWGRSQAINSGDAMFALSHLAMCRLREQGVAADIVVEALRRLDETCVNLTLGQYADMQFENEDQVTVGEYIEMIHGKTAALISLSSELGALIASADNQQVKHYAAFGRDLGLAFQVRDDILGIWGDEDKIGKSSATDIATRKKSLPVLYGLQESAELRHLYAQKESDADFVTQVIGILNRVGALKYAVQHEKEYADSALRHLDAARPKGEAARALYELAGVLLNRQT